MNTRYFGLYRGIVVNNLDPLQLGRLQLTIPTVPGASGVWALPSVPLADKQAGVFVLPQVGANIWAQFEAGSAEHPVWTGGWWASAADVPALAVGASPQHPPILLQTPLKNALMISDQPGPLGGIVLRTPDGATLVVNGSGIHLSNGKGAELSLVGPSVIINGGALVVD